MSHACKKRSQYLRAVRDFFHARSIIEVDTPQLNRAAQVDSCIEPVFTAAGYLHTSPEYGMKKLLADCPIDMYQICHVFRKEEEGPLHSTEFTMIEWYQMVTNLGTHIQANHDLLKIFLGELPLQKHSYIPLFEKYVGAHPLKDDLQPFAKKQGLSGSGSRELYIDFLWQFCVEPNLNGLNVVVDFPKEQAELAQIKGDFAQRFEIYYDGIELANGYLELTDSSAAQKRFEEINAKREKPLPIDDDFVRACGSLPACCGTALGFDRLVMLALGEKQLRPALNNRVASTHAK